MGLAAWPGGPALAHEEMPGVKAVLDSITPPLPAGVTVQTAISVSDQLVVQNTTGVDLIVLGEAGEPFLRIGPQGTFANIKSPTWYRSNDPTGAAVPPESADPKAEPVYARVTTDPSWGWFDHRMHRTTLTKAPAGAAPDKEVRLESWLIPMRYGGTPVAVQGHRAFELPGGRFEATVVRSPAEVRAVAFNGTVPAIGLFLHNAKTSAVTVTVLGAEGEPFARLSAAGVEVNEASPTWVFTAQGKGAGYQPTGAVGAKEPPRWKKESTGDQVTWLERRAQVVNPGESRGWEIPVLVGERADVISGVTKWQATSAAASSSSAKTKKSGKSSPSPLWYVLMFAGGAAAAFGILFVGKLVLTRLSPKLGE